MSWLDPIFVDTSPANPTLVLCHTSTSVAMVRRQIAKVGGVVGLAVMSPLGLARAIAPGHLIDDATESAADAQSAKEPSGDLWDRVVERRGLRRLLLEHVDWARLLGSAAGELDSGLADLIEQDFDESSANQALKTLLELSRHNGPRLAPGYEFSRVFALGFGDKDVGLAPPEGPASFYERLLGALGAVKLSAPVLRAEPLLLDVVKATDVVAEARWVAAEAARFIREGGNPERVLVLVSNRQDADRIRAALTRSGIPATDDGARDLREHGLTALLFRLLPWFGEEADPEIDGDLLRRLLQSRMLEHAWSGDELEPIRQDLLERVGRLTPPDPDNDESGEAVAQDPLYLARRQIPRVLRTCHVVKAPLEIWLGELDRVASTDSHPAYLRQYALVIRGRLQWLQKCRGEGDVPRTLGQLLDFLQGFGVKTFSGQDDAVAKAIQRSLKDNRALPATQDDLEDVLGGAVQSGEIHEGVVLLPFRNYDGRDAELLIVTGLHSKGIGMCPIPDPFFDQRQIEHLGIYQGVAWLDFMERQLVSAIRRSRQTRLCLARFDAGGRATAPYLYLSAEGLTGGALQVRLRLAEDVSDRLPKDDDNVPTRQKSIANYGLQVGSPEIDDLSAIGRRLEPAPSHVVSESCDDRTAHVALMASVEWIRAGSHVAGYQPMHELPEEPTLVDFRERYGGAIPDWAAAYMGDASGVPEAHLPPDANLSATYAFEPMTHCLFQAFGKVLLRLREPEVLSEELDAKETGTAAHEALRKIGHDTRWRVPQEQIEEARRILAENLSQQTDQQVGRFPAPTAGLRAAQNGMLSRWSRHWTQYVEQRVEELQPDMLADKHALSWLKKCPTMAPATDWLEEHIDTQDKPWNPKSRRSQLVKWFQTAAVVLANDGDPWSDEVFSASGLPKTVGRPAVEAFKGEPELAGFLADLAWSYRLAYRFYRARYGPILLGVPEWPFGATREAPEGPAQFIRLGNQSVQVNGAVDLIRVSGDEEECALEVLDYKSWKTARKRSEVRRGFLRGTMAQVPLYALVLKQAIESGWAPESIPEPNLPFILSHDFLRDPQKGKVDLAESLEGIPPAGDCSLEQFETLLGRLVGHARRGDFLALPHGDTCPVLQQNGNDYCPFGDICRFRSWPGAELRSPDDTESGTTGEEDMS